MLLKKKMKMKKIGQRIDNPGREGEEGALAVLVEQRRFDGSDGADAEENKIDNFQCSQHDTIEESVESFVGLEFCDNTEQILTNVAEAAEEEGKWKHRWDQFVCVGFLAVCVEWGRYAGEEEYHTVKEDYDRKEDTVYNTGQGSSQRG
ncbi:uncharacterized protein MONOS_8995 [Monocercomonoides exilis]|uniref:uncharacterized protein n=1 Tax=Monocercomonoides exilis TaxID=2049356 RepID=UPI00355A2FB2|nr:hypothetical protein MONOS_8995 [Monocercomonoides exilis]|eukprot:MONOS_8995.1-p1 / transcript=MONOS_8995.1 / gene=MONOS_8995 / organism=Monocercomonoides_exilis_PA203 / gene_product=unspecified product / transcript_product=unspecified product / location=Mono_scaffold00356:19368-20155(-) / protein_length=148 / sequence_SO=supercontig / SO=protein_coding / is_pseudo=false